MLPRPGWGARLGFRRAPVRIVGKPPANRRARFRPRGRRLWRRHRGLAKPSVRPRPLLVVGRPGLRTDATQGLWPQPGAPTGWFQSVAAGKRGRGRTRVRRFAGEPFSEAPCAFPPLRASDLPLQTLFVGAFVGPIGRGQNPTWPRSRRCPLRRSSPNRPAA